MLTEKDFGGIDETLRDFGRNYMAEGLYLVRKAAPHTVEKLTAPDGTPTGVEADALMEQKRLFLAQISSELPEGTLLAEEAIGALLRQLTVSPTFAVFTNAGYPPLLHQHRFIIRVGNESAEPSLRVHTVGFIGELPGVKKRRGPPLVLVVSTSNLLCEQLSSPCHISYRVAAAKHDDMGAQMNELATSGFLY